MRNLRRRCTLRMPRFPRAVAVGMAYHITQRGVGSVTDDIAVYQDLSETNSSTVTGLPAYTAWMLLPTQGGSRMRRRARTVLCGGRSAMVVPTATCIREVTFGRLSRSQSLEHFVASVAFCFGAACAPCIPQMGLFWNGLTDHQCRKGTCPIPQIAPESGSRTRMSAHV